jgi:hypothetical protein
MNGHSWAEMVRLEAVNDVTDEVVIKKAESTSIEHLPSKQTLD